MQKQNPIDDLFRSELADYEVRPSDERRAAFMQEAVGKPSKPFWLFWWLIGVTVVIAVGVGIALLLRDDRSISLAHDDRSLSIPRDDHSMPLTHDDRSLSIPRDDHSMPLTHDDRSLSIPRDENIGNSRLKSDAKPILNSGNKNEINSSGIQDPVPAERSEAADSIQSPESAERSEATPPATVQSTASAERSEAADSLPPSPDHDKSHPPKKWNISTGIYYTAESMFNTLNGDKFVNNFGIEGTFHFGRYSVRTGAGLSVTTGSNEILRQTNSYLGEYSALDSITFNWDTKHVRLVPTYYLKKQNVYDTTISYNYSYNNKRYTYLQLPLVLGYDFLQNNWLSIGIRGGVVMSLLLKSENTSDYYEPGKDKIITVNNVSPDRIQLNWQGIGGINATFRLSRRFSLEVEPEVRYYFNSVYESSEITTKPWSLGVRAAFIITW